jgi:phospholipid/cholesterol/gamma-HCH transport system substrate-binding protein
MLLPRDPDPRFAALPWKLAAFVLMAVGTVLGMLLLIAYRQGFFEDKTPLYFVSDSGTDLRIGMAVKFSGFKIGEVDRLVLDERGRVEIHVLVEDRYLRWIKADSIGRVGRDGPIGDSFVDVGMGDPKLPPVTAHTRLEFIPARSFDEVIAEVRERAMPVFHEVETLIKRLSDPQGDLNQTLANVRKLSEDVHTTRAQLDALLRQLNQLAARDVPATLDETRRTLESARKTLDHVEGRLPALLDQTDRTLGEAERAVRTARQTIEQAGPDAVDLIREGKDLVRKGNDTVDAVTGAWPLNRLMPAPVSQPPRSDSSGGRP